MERYTYVLVHGAWHGSWCWRHVTPLLTAGGHKVLTPTLTGLGDRAHLLRPEISLATHVADVATAIETEELADVILVGHSYAGMVITGAAERCADRIKRLVYLDALVPVHGQSGFDLNSEQFRETLEADAREHGDGYKVTALTPQALGITDPTDAEWVAARLVPHPIGTFRDPVEARDRVPSIASTFIFCTRFGFSDTAARCRANGWPVLEIDSGHDAMITNPQELAELLLSPECQ